MRERMICCTIAILISFAGFAQKKVQFRSINVAGIASGQSGAFAVVQTINGVEYSDWFFGIGAGIDNYKYRTMPLFADLRTFLFKTNIFIFGNIGYDFPLHNKAGKEVYYYDNHAFFGGSYYESGLGYKIKLSAKTYLLLSSGYSYKKLNNKTSFGTNDFGSSEDYNTYAYGFGRILFKAGIAL